MPRSDYPQGVDEYTVEEHPVEGRPLSKKWFIVGPEQPSMGGKFFEWKGYASKAGAQRALKRRYEQEATVFAGCPLCDRKIAELRTAAGCPIDSINCLGHRRFPSKQLPIKLARVQTRNDLHTVYAVVDDPNNMGIDKSNHPVIGFSVRTNLMLVHEDGRVEPVTKADVAGIIRDTEEGIQ